MTSDEFKKSTQNNIKLYEDYYLKPSWWFRLRYDTQVKKKTIFHLLRNAGRDRHNSRVLEVGFGSGEVIFSFDRSCEIYGLEISSSAIQKAVQLATKKGFKVFDFTLVNGIRLPYQMDVFDIVIASHVIEHIEDDELFLEEISRVLKPGGIAIFLVPINEKYDDPNHVRKYTEESFNQLIYQHGFGKPNFSLQNELLFHLVEKFYFEEYNYRWGIFGSLIAAVFNFSTFWFPLPLLKLMDYVLKFFNLKPRQYGCVVQKSDDRKN